MYELVNVVFALTNYGHTNPDLINKQTAYYQSVIRQFNPYKNHPCVKRMDSLLIAGRYFPLKMDSYAFTFTGHTITHGGIYDRVSWGDENTLRQHLPLLEDFAQTSGFRRFYRKNQVYYKTVMDDFNKNVALDTVKIWLEKNFPDTRYSAYKVICSPLVAANQSANWFADNNFNEAQAHINLPFTEALATRYPKNIVRGIALRIAFTEFNHAYINPEADKHVVSDAFGDLEKWTAGKASENYQNAYACFTEYMNWALVNLYYLDHFSASAFETLNKGVEDMMVNRRGFSRFTAFNRELLRLYKNRQSDETVADLYAPILAWAATQP